MDQFIVAWAADEARRLLEPLGPRWVHTVAVAERAREVAALDPETDADVLVDAAYLHDVGHAPSLSGTGHHGLDGAGHLRTCGFERLACLVAHHSGAATEADARGVAHQLASFPLEASPTADALTYCDVTTDLDGRAVSLGERLEGVVGRYGDSHVVTVAMRDALPELRRAVTATEQRLEAAALLAQAITG